MLLTEEECMSMPQQWYKKIKSRTSSITIRVGVKQGSVLNSLLFDITMEASSREFQVDLSKLFIKWLNAVDLAQFAHKWFVVRKAGLEFYLPGLILKEFSLLTTWGASYCVKGEIFRGFVQSIYKL